MATKSKQATAETVRTWAREQGTFTGNFLNENTRGRLPKTVVEAFEKSTKMTYVAGLKAEPTITLKVTKTDSKGHKRSRKVEKTLGEVRALAGEAAGKRGVLGKGAIAAAEAALSE